MAVFDTHAHYDDAAFDEDRDALLRSLPSAGVCGVLNAATSVASAQASLRMAERYPFVYAAVGVHPSDLDSAGDDTIAELAALAEHPKAVAIGEIGLDYHYDTFPREVQRAWLTRQVELAKDLDLPVILHDREAHEDTMELLRKYRPRGVVHCFSGSVEMMREVVRLGLFIGLGGAVTFKNARKPLQVAAAVPPDRLLLETDAPYMAPVPYRGKRCDSTMIARTAECIAAVRGCTVEALLAQTEHNVRAAFPKIS
ncbi:MAG: TatD family hydrolase [Clostridia bacterium]|nr:TatD family hydrolase [Clostridia bacterium]